MPRTPARPGKPGQDAGAASTCPDCPTTYRLDRGRDLSPTDRAVVADWEACRIGPGRAHMHGKDLCNRDTSYFAGFGFRHWRAIPHCLTDFGGVEWLEAVRPRRTLPVQVPKVTPMVLIVPSRFLGLIERPRQAGPAVCLHAFVRAEP